MKELLEMIEKNNIDKKMGEEFSFEHINRLKNFGFTDESIELFKTAIPKKYLVITEDMIYKHLEILLKKELNVEKFDELKKIDSWFCEQDGGVMLYFTGMKTYKNRWGKKIESNKGRMAWHERPLNRVKVTPPTEVLEKLEKVKTEKIFDYFRVASTDSRIFVSSTKRDPLLLGRLYACPDRFLIAQWGDDTIVDNII